MMNARMPQAPAHSAPAASHPPGDASLATGRPGRGGSGKPPEVPVFAQGQALPRVLHQTHRTKRLPPALAGNVEHLRRLNPEWTHKLYDDADIRRFIGQEYGADFLSFYDRISPKYMAAKIDLFRYLKIYKEGGVYLDIKSTFDRPIEDSISVDDRYVLAKWRNRPGEEHAGFGLHAELRHLPGGEFQQWHLIAAPGHPFLRRVIERVLANIDAYRPWRQGVGQKGVLRTTGPIAYTLAMEEILDRHPHRIVDPDAVGLKYTMLPGKEHKKLSPDHYVTQKGTVVELRNWNKARADIYLSLKRTEDVLLRMGRPVFKVMSGLTGRGGPA